MWGLKIPHPVETWQPKLSYPEMCNGERGRWPRPRTRPFRLKEPGRSNPEGRPGPDSELPENHKEENGCNIGNFY